MLELVKERIMSALCEATDADPEGDNASLEQIAAAAAAEVVSDLSKPVKGAISPPCEPVRYRLGGERFALTSSWVIHGKHGPYKADVTAGYYADGRLGEIFMHHEKEGELAGSLMDGIATVLSVALQHGVPWEAFGKKLAHLRFDPQGSTNQDHPNLRFASSPLDLLARWVGMRLDLQSALRLQAGEDGDDA